MVHLKVAHTNAVYSHCEHIQDWNGLLLNAPLYTKIQILVNTYNLYKKSVCIYTKILTLQAGSTF